MDAEHYASKIVGEARFHLRRKLEDDGGALPVVEIPYSKGDFRKISENYLLIKEYAEIYHLTVDYVADGTAHLRWAYKFEPSFDFGSNE